MQSGGAPYVNAFSTRFESIRSSSTAGRRKSSPAFRSSTKSAFAQHHLIQVAYVFAKRDRDAAFIEKCLQQVAQRGVVVD